jgi:hypothetical protein
MYKQQLIPLNQLLNAFTMEYYTEIASLSKRLAKKYPSLINYIARFAE